jgi:hypothetical protein
MDPAGSRVTPVLPRILAPAFFWTEHLRMRRRDGA